MKCPNCGKTITNFEILDTEFYHNAYYDKMIGTFKNCNKTYAWSEVFTYSHDTDAEEIKGKETI